MLLLLLRLHVVGENDHNGWSRQDSMHKRALHRARSYEKLHAISRRARSVAVYHAHVAAFVGFAAFLGVVVNLDQQIINLNLFWAVGLVESDEERSEINPPLWNDKQLNRTHRRESVVDPFFRSALGRCPSV